MRGEDGFETRWGFGDGLLIALDILDSNETKDEVRKKIMRVYNAYIENLQFERISQLKAELALETIL